MCLSLELKQESKISSFSSSPTVNPPRSVHSSTVSSPIKNRPSCSHLQNRGFAVSWQAALAKCSQNGHLRGVPPHTAPMGATLREAKAPRLRTADAPNRGRALLVAGLLHFVWLSRRCWALPSPHRLQSLRGSDPGFDLGRQARGPGNFRRVFGNF